MPLKAVIDTIDELEEPIKALYTQDGERFILDIEDFRDHPGIKPLSVAYERTQEGEKAAKEKVKALEAKLKELESKPKPTERDEAEIARIVKELEDERDQWKGDYERLSGELRTQKIRDQVQAALAANGVPEGMRRGAALDMLDGREVTIEGDAVVVKSVMGLEPVAAFAKSWLAKDGESYVAKPSGGNSNGSGGSGTPGLYRSKMSAADMAAYIAEHGQKAYLALPQ